MNIREKLENVRKLDVLIDAKLAERERLMCIATNVSPKPPDGMPFSNNGTVSRRVEDLSVKLADLARETDEVIDRYVNEKQEVVKLIETLPANEYNVIHKYYIEGKQNGVIAKETGYCLRSVGILKKNGLKILENSKTLL